MLLAADIGNTQTALGVFDGADLAAHWTVATRATDTADELQLTLASLLDMAGIAIGDIDGAAIASVVPALTASWTHVARRVAGDDVVVVGPGVQTGLAMRYDNPAEIGADRLADAVAAVDAVGAPVVVVDLGTATNIEVVDADGAFRGGVIAPGMMTGANALFQYAARLPQVDLGRPEHVIGTNTQDVIRSGLVLGEVDRVDGLVHRIFEELGYTAPVIATGGLSGYIADMSQTITRREPLLTLNGLRLIYEQNR